MNSSAVEGYPLAPQQRRLWKLRPDHRSRLEISVDGPLDRERLRAAFTAVTVRHEALRTRLAHAPYHRLPVQVIEEQSVIPFTVERVQTQDRHVVIVDVPALVADTTSLSVIAEDLVAAYRGEALPGAVQYAQFDAWQRSVQSQSSPAEEISTVGVGAEGPRPGTRAQFAECSPCSVRVKKVTDAPADSILMAAWAMVVSRRVGVTELTLGHVFDSRVFEELRSTVGLLARTLPVTVITGPDRALRDLARDVDEAVTAIAERFKIGALPDADLDVDGIPLQFESVLAGELNPVGDTVFTVTGRRAVTDPFDAKLVAVRVGNGLELDVWVGSGDVQLAEDLAEGLAELLRDPESGVVTGALERERLVKTWGSGRSIPIPPELIHEVFGRQAAESPDSLALVEGPRTLTYSELDALTNKVAHGLRNRGIGAESTVALCGDRSTDAVVGMLGVLKAGGAFVPIDHESPDEHLRHVMRDAAVDVVLSTAGTAARLDRLGLDHLDLGAALGDMPNCSVPTAGAHSANLAYVIFTSGSTGWPKGVAVTHENLVHYVAAARERLELQPGWSYVTVATAAADLGYTAMFGALLTGGCLHVLGRDLLLDPTSFAKYQQENDIDCVKTTPSHFKALFEAVPGVEVFPRRLLVLGGEAIEPAWLTKIAGVAGDCTVANHYGPTETTVGVLARRLSRSDVGEQVSMGTPMDRNRIHLLDEELRAVPVGVPGELYVGGPGVARGYHRRPDLTAERFVPDPFATEPGARLYRTGDLARWRPDGTVAFLGRADDQAKVRGYRVERTSVVRHLSAHPAVGQAVVVVRQFPDGQDGLAGYVVPGTDYLASRAAALSRDQVGGWKDVFDNVYADRVRVTGADAEFDLAGWNSSYTGKVMTDQEISESVEGIVRRVTSLPHSQVLEIGCGTGLLLFRIAPQAKRYWATDISGALLRAVERGLDGYPCVTLLEREATDFDGFTDDSLDLVILNSVVQYFPSVDYLKRVLGEAVRVVKPGGNIFVGDVRDLRLLDVFHSSVQLHLAGGEAFAGDVLQRVHTAVDEEGELLLDPAYFAPEGLDLPGIGAVTAQLKLGVVANELNKFRYDVVLHVGEELAIPSPEIVPWKPADLHTWLDRDENEVLITDVPDARTASDVASWTALAHASADTAVRYVLADGGHESVAPAEWLALGESRGMTVAVVPPRSGEIGRYDVSMSRSGRTVAWEPGRRPGIRFNIPCRPKLAADLARELRTHLQDLLPEYMVPGHIAVIDKMPLTPTGKLDVARLPEPSAQGAARGVEHVLPSTPVEEVVAEIWGEVLGVDEISVVVDFFDIGGHSLLAVQTVYRIREALGIDLTLRDFFAYPTVARLSLRLAQLLYDEEAV